MYDIFNTYEDTPLYREAMLDGTPLFRELIEADARSRRLAGSLVEAVYADHYAEHDGPIMFCDAAACRTAFAAVKKTA